MDNRIDAIYGRQSIDKKDSISIESQFEFCRYELKGGEAKEYKDKGYSGKNIERPDFQRLLKDIRAGLIRRVIVYKLDRISLSTVHFQHHPPLHNLRFGKRKKHPSAQTDYPSLYNCPHFGLQIYSSSVANLGNSLRNTTLLHISLPFHV